MSTENTIVNNKYSVRHRKYGVKNLEDKEIIKIYKEEIRKWITENNEQQSNRNEERSKTQWENSKKVLTAVPSKVVECEEWKQKSD